MDNTYKCKKKKKNYIALQMFDSYYYYLKSDTYNNL